MSRFRRHYDPNGDRHHRKPKSRGGRDVERNISQVHTKYHRAFHLLFGNMNAKEVAKVLTDCWIDPDFYMVCFPRKKKKRRKSRVRRYCDECNCVVLQHVPKTCRRICQRR